MTTPRVGSATLPKVHQVRHLTDSTYVVRFDRDRIRFEPGQYVSVGIKNEINMREYSIYSGTEDDFIEILVKEVDSGSVSKRLKLLTPGDEIVADGPFGFFLIDPTVRVNGQFLFIATGTGISPFHSMTRSYPDLDYRILHGVRTLDEQYDYDNFESSRVTTCVSRDKPTSVPGLAIGRVTDYLRDNPVPPETLCYLCGNCDMIYESFDILKGHGVPPEQLFAEVYF